MASTEHTSTVDEAATQLLTAVLVGETDIHDAARQAAGSGNDLEAYNAFSRLLSTRDELERLMWRAEERFASARDFLHGKPGHLLLGGVPRSGMLGGEGGQIDTLAAIFSERLETTLAVLRRTIAASRESA